ncbi:MAG: hypothetical protein CL677_08935 [Bdellovibrionaceae bacterium]|nr:hypothetical protein [Pseudobdellovibrionaceae bacterium]
MKQSETKQTLLVFGLFAALAFNISGFQMTTLQVAQLEEGNTSLSSLDNDRRIMRDRGQITSETISGGQTDSDSINVKLGNGKSQRVKLKAEEAYSQTEVTSEQRRQNQLNARRSRNTDNNSIFGSTAGSFQIATGATSTPTTVSTNYDDLRQPRTNELVSKHRGEMERATTLNQELQTLIDAKRDLIRDGASDADVEAKQDEIDSKKNQVLARVNEAKRIENYIQEYRRVVKIQVEDLPEGFWDVCTDNCDASALVGSEYSMLNSEDVDDVSLMNENLIASLEDFGSVAEALDAAKQAIKDKNSANTRQIRRLQADINKRKKCLVDEDLTTKVPSKERHECWMDLLSSLQGESEPWLYKDEDERERLMRTAANKLKPYLRKGNLADRLEKIDDVLDIFDVSVSNNDYDMSYVDEGIEPIVGNLLVERYNTQTLPEVRNAAQTYSQARYYGAENKDIIAQMENVFQRNGINNYVYSRHIDPEQRDQARIISRSAIDMYCGARTNLNPNYPASTYDWNCANANRGGYTSGQDILMNLDSLSYNDSYMSDLGYDRGLTDSRSLMDRGSLFDFDRNMSSNRRPLDRNSMAGMSYDNGRRLGNTNYANNSTYNRYGNTRMGNQYSTIQGNYTTGYNSNYNNGFNNNPRINEFRSRRGRSY